MVEIISLSWPSSLRPLSNFHQNQFAVHTTGPVECVTTAVVIARNIMNEMLAFRTGRIRLPDLELQDFINQIDGMGLRGLAYRFPTRFPDISVPLTTIKLNPRGFMLPRSQARKALKRFSNEFGRYYGSSFSIQQTAGCTIRDIAKNLQAGNLVLISGMHPPIGLEQNYLGGSPHTFGPVVQVDFSAGIISCVDTGKNAISNFKFDEFMRFWGRKSRLNVYSRPYTMTILAPDPPRAS